MGEMPLLRATLSLLDVLTADRSIKAALATERGHYKVSGDVIVDRYSAEGEQPGVSDKLTGS